MTEEEFKDNLERSAWTARHYAELLELKKVELVEKVIELELRNQWVAHLAYGDSNE